MGEPLICGVCNKPITSKVLTTNEGSFHPECFCCDSCRQPLTSFHRQPDGRRLCKACIPKLRCYACKDTITGNVTKAEGRTYHAKCFVCEADGCTKALAGGFCKFEDKLMCQNCTAEARSRIPTPGTQQIKSKVCPPTEAAKLVCRKCKENIDPTTKYITADRDDTFHEACFTCVSCGLALTEYVVDPNRKFAYQNAFYRCKPCTDMDSQSPAEQARKKRTCYICMQPCANDENTLQMLDGHVLHLSCFKCPKCGNVEPLSQSESGKLFGRALRAKAESLRRGDYSCDACARGSQPDLPPMPIMQKAPPTLPQGCYYGTKEEVCGSTISYAVRLKSDGKCKLDCSISGTDPTTWCAEGTFVEDDTSSTEGRTIRFTVGAVKSGAGATVGQVFAFPVDKGYGPHALYCEGVHCPLSIGLPDFEIATLMRPQRTPARRLSAAAPAPAAPTGGAASPEPAPAPAAAVPEGCLSLEDLRDPAVWKPKGIDAGSREQCLSDDTFAALFGMAKPEFLKLPKWKRDQKKKEHGLF